MCKCHYRENDTGSIHAASECEIIFAMSFQRTSQVFVRRRNRKSWVVETNAYISHHFPRILEEQYTCVANQMGSCRDA